MEPSLRQIRYFIATVNAGQISQAAKDVSVSQSAITTAIKALENIIGAPLFNRHSGGVILTFEGAIFLEHAKHIVASVNEAIRISSRIRPELNGTLNLAVSYTVSGYFIPSFLARFSRSFPNLKINMTEADRTEIEDGLVTKKFDLAVMLTSNIVNQEALAHEILLRSKRRLWTGVDHPFLSQSSITLKDISSEPYIMLTVDEASNTAQRYWNCTSYRPKTIFRTYSVEAVRSLVANGMGIAILSDMVYRPWSLEGRRVEALTVSDEIPTLDIGFAWSKSTNLTESVRAFIDFMRFAIGAEDPMT